MLETEALCRRFGALAAVGGVTLSFEAGKIHAVIGPNGAGKSTLLAMLSGELRATSGKVRLRGVDVTRLSPDRLSLLGVGRSYQTANIFSELTCSECAWLAAQSRSPMRFFSPSRALPAAESALTACGLSSRGAVRAGELSYGEQRQLEIAMVLATGPSLLLLDEPLAGLGHDEAVKIVALLRELARDRTVILVEHDMDAVFSIADTVTVLVGGRVLERGTPHQIRASKAVRDAYLGDQP
jgi:branched-chain amino acid transport system ATP-binding protein